MGRRIRSPSVRQAGGSHGLNPQHHITTPDPSGVRFGRLMYRRRGRATFAAWLTSSETACSSPGSQMVITREPGNQMVQGGPRVQAAIVGVPTGTVTRPAHLYRACSSTHSWRKRCRVRGPREGPHTWSNPTVVLSPTTFVRGMQLGSSVRLSATRPMTHAPMHRERPVIPRSYSHRYPQAFPQLSRQVKGPVDLDHE
ncbi:hypothetical protein QFZ40_003990 [Arthrobacter pascens]|nr:hypothetical protein [Arthrobacter pascens]